MMNDLFKKIHDALVLKVQTDGNVFFGLAQELDEWNYTVFNRTEISTQNKIARVYSFEVHVIRENYVPIGTENLVSEAMKSIKGMKEADAPAEVSYIKKGNTGIVVEMITMKFTKAMSI